MQKKSNLFAMIILSLVMFSSFTPHPSRIFTKAPSRGDVFVQNNTDQVLTRISYVSSLDDITWTNVAVGDSRASALAWDFATDDVNIYIYFATVPRRAVANIYTSLGLTTIPIVSGVNQITFPAPFQSGGIVVHIDPI